MIKGINSGEISSSVVVTKMAERVEASSVTEGENTIEEREVGAMWELEQKLDQPMDEEANKLNNMSSREKVITFSIVLVLDFDGYSENLRES